MGVSRKNEDVPLFHDISAGIVDAVPKGLLGNVTATCRIGIGPSVAYNDLCLVYGLTAVLGADVKVDCLVCGRACKIAFKRVVAGACI